MNERDELAHLKAQQARLAQELEVVALRLQRLERRLNASPAHQTQVAPGESAPAPSTTPVSLPAKAPVKIEQQPAAPFALEVPPIISPAPGARARALTAAGELEQPAPAAAARPRPTPPPVPAEDSPGTQHQKTGAEAGAARPQKELSLPVTAWQQQSLELRLGTYWAPRVGIVVLLTGLVFIGNLAYQKLGALGKVLLLYCASGILLGAGAWWQRHGKNELKNYAQVLFAGGLAALYFTTYGAHHLEALRVINSPLLDGVLLLGCAGFMIWTADRWRSEVLAIFGVGLAYYSCVMTRVGFFTLYSNLVLTAAAVIFLVRNRWVALSFGSLLASYAAYAFWRFFSGTHWHWASPSEGLWSGTYFLFSYWAVFTAGIFLSKDEHFKGQNRAAFLTLNNGAMFALFILTMLQVSTGGFWKFCLVYGGVLLGLAEAASRWLRDEPLAKNFYLTQGLLLATVGFISKWAGLQLGLILSAESVLVLLVAYERQNLVLQVGAYVVAALGLAWGIDGLRQFDPAGSYLGCGLGALMLVNALIAHKRALKPAKLVLRPDVSYFVLLALAAWWVTTWNQAARQQFPLLLAGEGVLFAVSVCLLGVFELSFFGLVYLLLAQIDWFLQVVEPGFWPAWWNPVAMLAVAMGINFWWRSQETNPLRSRTEDPWPALDKMPVGGKNLVLLAVAWVGIKLAGGGQWLGLPDEHPPQFYLPLVLGAMALADGLRARPPELPRATAPLRLQAVYSVLVALCVWLAVTWFHTTRTHFALVLSAEGLLLTISIYLLGFRELSILSQGYLVLAQVAWILIWLEREASLPWWNPLLLVGMTLFVSHWWQKQKILHLTRAALRGWQIVYGLALVGILYFWLQKKVSSPHWLALTAVLGLGLTVYAVVTRAWLLVACAQLFSLASLVQFAVQLSRGHPAWQWALLPIGSLSVLSWGTVNWFQSHPTTDTRVRHPVTDLALVYRWVALLMLIAWVWEYIPDRERIWVFFAMGLAAFICAGLLRSTEALLFVLVFTGCGLALFWLPWPGRVQVYGPNLAAILVLLAEEQAAKHLPERYRLHARAHRAVVLVGGVSLWLFCTNWVREAASGFYLTASWSLLALAFFICGILVRDRVYRWLGLGLLACALGRIVIFDVWKLETLYRILSFMALGIVLLVLGFVYSKYQEKIREWL